MTTHPFVVWDLDGTLIDSGRDIAVAANAARSDLGRSPLSEETVLSYVGEGAVRLMDRVIGESEPPEVKKAAVDRFFVRYGERLAVHTRPYAGVDELVRRLDGWQAIATNKPSMFAHQLVDLLNWSGLFRAIVGGGDVANRKPAPEALLKAIELSGASISDTVFVGDTSIDIDTAAAAGVRCVCVSWGLRPREELKNAPLIVDTAEELSRAIFG